MLWSKLRIGKPPNALVQRQGLLGLPRLPKRAGKNSHLVLRLVSGRCERIPQQFPGTLLLPDGKMSFAKRAVGGSQRVTDLGLRLRLVADLI